MTELDKEVTQVIENVPLLQRYNTDTYTGEDANDESYNRVSVSNFGLNMLKDMGWYEGRGIGKNTQYSMHHTIEFLPRHHRQGLGADPKPSFLTNKSGKHKQQVIEEKIKSHKDYIDKDSVVQIVKGKHKDLSGTIISINREQKECYIELKISEETVKVSLEDVKIYKEIQNKSRSRSRSPKQKKIRTLQWVIPQIRVRIIDKKNHYYNQKVIIQDKLSNYQFSAITKTGDVLDELTEKQIETVMPQINEKAIFVLGLHKFQVGTLIERDKKLNKVFIRVDDTFEIIQGTQDDIAEYIL